MQRATEVRRALILLLVAVGVLRAISHFADMRMVSGAALRLGASPLPIVFSRVRNMETFGRRFELTLVTEQGEQFRFETAKLGRSLHGPFTRRKLYLDRIAFWDLIGAPNTTAFFEHAVCGVGPLARELGIRVRVSRIVIDTWSAIQREPPKRTFEMRCRA